MVLSVDWDRRETFLHFLRQAGDFGISEVMPDVLWTSDHHHAQQPRAGCKQSVRLSRVNSWDPRHEPPRLSSFGHQMSWLNLVTLENIVSHPHMFLRCYFVPDFQLGHGIFCLTFLALTEGICQPDHPSQITYCELYS